MNTKEASALVLESLATQLEAVAGAYRQIAEAGITATESLPILEKAKAVAANAAQMADEFLPMFQEFRRMERGSLGEPPTRG